MKEKCGLAGIYNQSNSEKKVLSMLLKLQHRGQAGAGISSYNPSSNYLLKTKKGIGDVQQALGKQEIDNNAKSTIGHVRYATSGIECLEQLHPFERKHGKKWKWFSFAFNGNIANYKELENKLKENEYHICNDVDTEILMHLIAREFKGKEKPDYTTAFENISKELDGAYNILYLNAEGTMLSIRDPLGIRPLSYSENGEIASESCAIEGEAKDLEPGEILICENGNIEKKRYAKKQTPKHCFFEYVYFANPVSVLDKINVYEARLRLGKELAKKEKLETNSKDWVVVPVPDTSKPSAEGYSEVLGLPVREGILRNRYIGRTFIEGENRERKINAKYSFIKNILQDKKIILIDDSIVRGNTMKSLISRIRDSGAKQIHLRISCPPIISPCFYGIDMPTKKELLAYQKMKKEERENPYMEISEETNNEICKELGADSLTYQTMDGLVKAIGLPKENLCLACINKQYPTEKGKELAENQI